MAPMEMTTPAFSAATLQPLSTADNKHAVTSSIITSVHGAPGPQSTRMTCPDCCREIDTSITSTPSTVAYVVGAIIALFGCFCGCCLVPCFLEELQDMKHHCPNCKAFLGRYYR